MHERYGMIPPNYRENINLIINIWHFDSALRISTYITYLYE